MTVDQRLRSMRKTMRDMFGIARLRAEQGGHYSTAYCNIATRLRRCPPARANHFIATSYPRCISKHDARRVAADRVDETQADQLLAAGIDCTLVNSTLKSRAEREALQRIAAGDSGIVFVTPERLAQPAFIETLRARPEIASASWSSTRRIACRIGDTISVPRFWRSPRR